MSARIVKVDQSPVARLDDPVDPARRVAGTPMRGARPAHDDEASGFWSGVWESEPGAWKVSYDENELCVILAGRLRLTGEDGASQEFAAGDAFVVPKGFRGTWETIEHVRKIYAIAT